MNKKNTINNMITQQLRTGNVLNESILELYELVSRDEFVPTKFKEFAYSDMQIPLANHQLMMTPLEEALILQSLSLTGKETILEIGTGTGFLAALLSRLCHKVISIDYFEEFTSQAKVLLEKFRCTNVELITGDASQGWVDKAPYDVIIFSGSIEKLSEIQKLQLLPGGKLIAILGKSSVMEAKLFELDHNKNWTQELLFETKLPPLINNLDQKPFVF
jgi:protein-L-isoaspartate(D-aspartate) O-methyltransferase